MFSNLYKWYKCVHVELFLETAAKSVNTSELNRYLAAISMFQCDDVS